MRSLQGIKWQSNHMHPGGENSVGPKIIWSQFMSSSNLKVPKNGQDIVLMNTAPEPPTSAIIAVLSGAFVR